MPNHLDGAQSMNVGIATFSLLGILDRIKVGNQALRAIQPNAPSVAAFI